MDFRLSNLDCGIILSSLEDLSEHFVEYTICKSIEDVKTT